MSGALAAERARRALEVVQAESAYRRSVDEFTRAAVAYERAAHGRARARMAELLRQTAIANADAVHRWTGARSRLARL